MKIYAVAQEIDRERERRQEAFFFSVPSIVIYTDIIDYILLITFTFCCFFVDISVNIYNVPLRRTIIKRMSLRIQII